MFRRSAMKVFVDHYVVLGLPSGKEGRMLGKREIIKAYRSKALELHPDKRPKSEAATASRQFRKLKDSFDVLSDAGKREAFDAAISSGERAEGCERRRREAEAREEEERKRRREEAKEWWEKREEERRQREEQEWRKREELRRKREEEIEAREKEEQKRRREEERKKREEEEEWRRREEQEWKKREDERRRREEEEAAETQRETEADIFQQVMEKTLCFDGVDDDIPDAWRSFLHKEKDAFMS